MRTIELTRLMTAEEATNLIGDKVPELDPTDIAPGTIVRDADTGTPVLIYEKLADAGPLRRAMLSRRRARSNGATATWNPASAFSRNSSPRRRKPRSPSRSPSPTRRKNPPGWSGATATWKDAFAIWWTSWSRADH